jgi:hypothetical protein
MLDQVEQADEATRHMTASLCQLNWRGLTRQASETSPTKLEMRQLRENRQSRQRIGQSQAPHLVLEGNCPAGLDGETAPPNHVHICWLIGLLLILTRNDSCLMDVSYC